MPKPFQTINKQITILKNRGMKFKYINKAKETLKKSNYYNIINGYKELIIDKTAQTEKYKDGLFFDEVIAVAHFDHQLRFLFLKYILSIENELRSKVAYEFSKNNNPYSWNDVNSYEYSIPRNQTYIDKLIEKLNDIISRSCNSSQDDMVSHFTNNGGVIPIWAFVNTFDFGTLKTFYLNLKQNEKQDIAQSYLLTIPQLTSFLETLNMFRNVCAHSFRILYYRIYDNDKKISDMPLHRNLNVDSDFNGFIHGKNDLFAVVIIFRYMLREDEFKLFYKQLKNLIEELDRKIKVISINEILDSIGFPIENDNGQLGWSKLLEIEK